MKLLILNYEYPPLGGGAGVCTKYQAEGLSAIGYQVTVCTTWFSGEKEVEEHENLKIIRLKSWRKKVFRSNPSEMLSWSFHTLRYLIRYKLYKSFDLLLVHFTVPGGLVALPLNLLFKKPYFIISHGQDLPWFCPRELWLYHLIMYLPIRWICSRAEKITVLSQKRLADLNRLTFRKNWYKNHIVPNGCDIDFFKAYSVEKDHYKLKILFIGRLSEQKDPLTFLRAISIFKTKGIPFTAEIIGDGPLRNKMERYIMTNKLENEICFSGWISKEEIREKYKQAHLLVATSRDEGMSLTMLESLSSGIYLLTTPVSGSENIIINNVNGEFIPQGNPAQIAECIGNFYSGKFISHYRIDRNAIEKIQKQLGWDTYVKSYHQLIQQ